MNKVSNILAILMGVVFITLIACNTEGVGGKSTIHGKLKREWIYNTPEVLYTDYAENVSVYIEYGDDATFYSDDVKTDKEGEYEFRYLYKGNYRIYAYSECYPVPPDSCLDGSYASVIDVSVSENGVTEAPEIIIQETI